MLFGFLRRNLGLKIFSLVLSLGLWVYVKYNSTPLAAFPTETEFKGIPLVVEGVGDNLIALEIPENITVFVKGKPDAIGRIKSEHFKARVNLEGKKSGLYNVAVTVSTPADVKIIKTEPSLIKVRLDPIEKRLFTVKVKTQGTVNPGFILGKMAANPQNVTVSGAKSIVSKVKEVRAVCNIEGADMDLVQRVGIEIIDEKDKIVENVKAEPSFVRASVFLKQEVVNATVPVTPNLTGTPAKGYRISKITVTPPSATISYRYDSQAPPKGVKTEKISIEGAKGSVAVDASLEKPGDLTLVEPVTVKVHVLIEKTKKHNGK